MPKKSAKTAAKTVKTTEKTEQPAASRQLTPDSFKSKRLRRKAVRQEIRRTKLPNAFRLFGQACSLLARHWEVFGGILLIYGLLNLLLIGGVNGGGDLQATKDSLGAVFTGQFSQLSTGLTLFTFLVATGTGTTASGVTGAYQTMLLVLISLILIWALRQVYAGQKIRVRDGFYRGTYPLVQFILVLLFIGLQLLPALAGGYIIETLVSNGLLTVLWEQLVAIALGVLLIFLSVYWVCSSLVALYVVTLPDMTPWLAIRKAREITKYRRASILRKLLFLIPAFLIPAALIMIPVVLYILPAAIPIFFVMSIVAVALVHSYLYALYRELIA